MRRIFALLFTVAMVPAVFHVCFAEPPERAIFQISTMTAFKQGEYDGRTTFAQLKEHGDFGIGTVNELDGEMIALDGKFFQIKSDGTVHAIDDSEKTPFAMVTFFKADGNLRLSVENTRDFARLKETLDRFLPSTNPILAIRVDGEFTYVKVRSVPRQQKPYVKLEVALKNQTVFDLRNVRGSMVGFRFPSYMEGINDAGYHFHFITQDRKAGGHVLECGFKGLPVEIAGLSRFGMTLLSGPLFIKP
jgi:acetolactate decarboxylase